MYVLSHTCILPIHVWENFLDPYMRIWAANTGIADKPCFAHMRMSVKLL